MGERGRVCVMRSPPVRGVGGGCRRVGLERRVLLAASSHLEVPARGTTQSRRERGGGRRDGGSGGPTRWGERGAAVGRCAGRWTGVRGLGCCGAGRTSHGGRQTPSRKRRACQKARKTGVGVWVSMRGAGVDWGCAWGGVRRDAGRARGGKLWRRTRHTTRPEGCLAAAGGRWRRREGGETAAARAEGQGGRVRAPAATLTCKIIRRDAKRHLSERGGEGEEKVKAEGLRGLCAVRGCECAGRPLTNVTKNLDPPRAGRLLLEKKRTGSGRR